MYVAVRALLLAGEVVLPHEKDLILETVFLDRLCCKMKPNEMKDSGQKASRDPYDRAIPEVR